jgi:ubiquinone/menaquinone biosynthesis C-methylase UbiE
MFSDPLKNIAQMYIAEGMHIADFGAGVGFYSLALAKRVGEYGKVFALDVQAEHLSALQHEAKRQNLNNIEILHVDVEAPRGSGLQDASIDRVLIINMLFQNEKLDQIAAEATRILKQDGKIGVIEWIDSFDQMGPEKNLILKKEDIIALFEKAGCTVEKEFDAGTHHYGLLFKRL